MKQNQVPLVVTVSSGTPKENYYTYRQFFASLLRHDFEPLVLGQNPGEFKGLGSKPRLLLKAILNNSITSDYIIFADSWDLVFTESPWKIMEKYQEFNSPFVCSSEKNCFPADLKDSFPESPTSYRYLNSGFIVAETEAILVVLESMNLDAVPEDHMCPDGSMYHCNDQGLFIEQFIQQPVKMVLDYRQELSQTLCGVVANELDMSGNKIRNIETGSLPMSLHFNGPAKTAGLREPILNKLGL